MCGSCVIIAAPLLQLRECKNTHQELFLALFQVIMDAEVSTADAFKLDAEQVGGHEGGKELRTHGLLVVGVKRRQTGKYVFLLLRLFVKSRCSTGSGIVTPAPCVGACLQHLDALVVVSRGGIRMRQALGAGAVAHLR